jgi:NitT/TauT family transport system substrate-binding protein
MNKWVDHKKSWLVAAILAAAAVAGPAQTPTAPLAIYGNRTTFEAAPVLLAAERMFGTPDQMRMGGIANLYGEAGVAGFSSPGTGDVATHAETQALRYSVAHPDLRIIMTVSQGHYRLLARRSAGIARVADLRGKRIAAIPGTSSGYFLHKLLQTAGLDYREVTVVPISPLSDMPKALADGRIDAMTIWEPEIEKAARLIGKDGIEFEGQGVYRELFGLNTTAANLADPTMRARIVRFVRGVIDASAAIRRDPALGQRQVVQATGETPAIVAASWPHQTFPAALAPDLLDVMTEEERWLAARDNRPARPRATLAKLIDPSALREALALPREPSPSHQ